MEISPTAIFSAIALLVNLIVIGVALTTYLVQLKPRLDNQEKHFDELQKSFEIHRFNNDIHFDEKRAKQVELRLTVEIENVKKSVEKIDVKVDRLLERK